MLTKRTGMLKRVILWSLITLLIMGAAGLFAVNYAIKKTIESMSASLDSDPVIEKSPSDDDLSSPNVEESLTPPSSTPSASEQPDHQAENKAENKADDEPVKKTDPNTQMKQPSKQKDKSIVYEPEVSLEKAKAIQKSITLSDKTTVTKILLKHLSTNDINILTSLAGGGLTSKEKREAKLLLLERLSPDEYDTLSSIAKKYGVSRGKTYEQAMKEEEDSKS